MARARTRSSASRSPKRRPASKAVEPPPASVVPGSLPRDASRLPVLAEPPHAHVVCRVCGRIADVPLDTESQLLLEQLAHRRPDGWSVDLITFSLTGACARCREGPAAPT